MSVTTYYDKLPMGFPGMEGPGRPNDGVAPYVSEEASAEIPFGVFVVKSTTVAVTTPNGSPFLKGCKLPTNTSTAADILGIVLHSHAYDRVLDLGTVGVKPGRMVNVREKGRIIVQVEEAVSQGDRVFMRTIANGAGKLQLGGIRKSVDNNGSADTAIAVKGARFWSSATAGGLAIVEFDALITRSHATT